MGTRWHYIPWELFGSLQRNHGSNDLNSCSANIGRVKDIAQTGVHPAQSGNSMGLGQFVSDAPRAGDFLCPRFGSQKMRRLTRLKARNTSEQAAATCAGGKSNLAMGRYMFFFFSGAWYST